VTGGRRRIAAMMSMPNEGPPNGREGRAGATNPLISGRMVSLRPFEPRDRDVYVRWRNDQAAMRTAGFSGGAPISTAEVDKLFASFAENQAKTGYQFAICRMLKAEWASLPRRAASTG
jgi:GNAT acetyltransferase-like protein